METRGRKIYFDIENGNVIFELGEGYGLVPTTIEQDIATFTALSERNRDTFDVIELAYGKLAQDFAECNGYSVDVTLLSTLAEDERWKAIVFTVADPSNPDVPIVLDKPLSVQIDDLKAQLMTADDKYKALDLATADLQTVKDAKMGQLTEACNKSITDGFDYTINSISYKFSVSLEAQSNFQGTDALFKDAIITETQWTVISNTSGKTERITLDQATFNSLKLEVFSHINSNISKLRNTLQPQVNSATTNTDVDAINW